ncbi:hypothetical protein AU509_07365 [Lonsdalea britannica]|uniref:Uncharacterized protein n=2 Tax=Lonsdalea britannica TaxID=1082704 RepID=A0AAD0WLE8_9GAMM|nr:hypothetical protein CKQ53_12945 [Lonsdalea britannica]OSM98332.1 hypothetical protein AU509_07365 [Lonsdalea britannica]
MDILDKRLSKLSTESREVVDAYAEEYMSQLNRLAVEHMWREILNESTDFISEAIEVEGYHDITNDYTQDVCYHFALCRLERDKRMNDEYKLELRLLERGAA